MRIANVKTWLVEGVKYNWTLVKVETESGLTGIGEGTNWPGSPLVEAACRHVGERIIGQDARRIDYLWTKLYKDLNWLGQAGPLMSAISAIDIALWDLQGKALGVPVYQLLGGAYRKEILLYANYWFIEGEHTAADYARQAREVAALGFTALKFDPFAHVDYHYGDDLATDLSLTEAQKRLAIDVIRAVQDAVGPDVQLAIETHAMLNAPTAFEMAQRIRAAGINCLWYEEPAPPETPDAIADLRARIGLPVAVGERLHSRYMFRPVLERHAADFLMPDVTRCGGISELRKIATLAETFSIPVAPHNPNGPISTIASAHAMAATPNFSRLEFMLKDVPWRDAILSPSPLPVSGGKFHLSDRPGLGFDLVEAELEKHPGVRVPRPGFYV
jgi:galactonate dehydratase